MWRSEKILGDAPDRSYAAKLERFAEFAAPELRQIFADLRLPSTGSALDLGCGTGLTTALLAEALGPDVFVVGLDLSAPHLNLARRCHDHSLIQCDAENLAFRNGSFDFIWSCNTINHVGDKAATLKALRKCLRVGGRIVLAQSGFLPEMFFAWDSHLDDAVRVACHQYYRKRYALEPSDTEDLRNVVGLLHSADFDAIDVCTHTIERTQPLTQFDRAYFQSAVFEGFWGEKIRPFLDSTSLRKLESYCDPESEEYCLDRSDFHHIQTVTVCTGAKAT